MIWTLLPLLTALGAGLVAGVFYAFSTFVMPGLAMLSPPQGIAAMQAINIRAVTTGFMTGFMGTAALSIVVLVAGALGYADGWAMGGALLYLVGCLGVTIAANVPRNNVLARLDPAAPEAAAAWARYQAGWTRWNHLRGGAALIACAALIVSLMP